MKLVSIYLDAGDENAADDHLIKWSQAQYDYTINDLQKAFS